MELWIRSQNKKRLMKVEMVEFDKQIDGPAIIYSHEYMLGEYKTKERALEVLDEIQCKIAQNECLKTMMIKLNSIKGEEEKIGKLFKETIYEMPEK
ncbi:MAG: hypothetical protein IJ501_06635 [Bacilli bacterium]|nr:hypothetical protein [Bacilli bacterium]